MEQDRMMNQNTGVQVPLGTPVYQQPMNEEEESINLSDYF